MKSFSYVAIDRTGLRQQGTLTALSEPEARSQLTKKGLLVEFVGESVVAAAPKRAAAASPPASWSSTVSAKYEPESLQHFYRQVGAMLNAGVPLVTALTSISAGAFSPRIQSAIIEMKDGANRGDPISKVAEKRSDIFPGLHAAVLAAAERGGFMDRALVQLADYLRQEIQLRNQWKRRTFYPKLLLAVALLIIVIANLIIKYISNVTGGPAMYLTNVLLNPWVGIPIVIAAVVVALFLRHARFSAEAAFMRDKLVLAVPYYGPTAHMYAIAKFSRALALLFNGGVPIREAVSLSADASGNVVIAREIRQIANSLNEGASVWQALKSANVFTSTALDMVQAGEVSGSLQSLLDHLAVHYEEEGQVRMTKFTTVTTLAVLILVLLIVASSIVGFYLNYIGQFQNLMQ
jgi:type II secretory pathway component PulF